jgi:hypothetical protein
LVLVLGPNPLLILPTSSSPTLQYDFVWLLEDDVQYMGNMGKFFSAYASDATSDFVAKMRYMPQSIGDEDHVETNVNIRYEYGIDTR